MSKHEGSKRLSLSRRGFLRTSALGAAGGGLLLGTSNRAEAAEADDLLQEFVRTISTLQAEQPDLPGLVSITEFISTATPPGLSAEDRALLSGALYLKATRVMERTCGFPSPSEIEPTLSRPQPMEQLGREYFSSVLAQTKAQMEANPEYAERIWQASDAAAQLDEGNDGNDAARIPIIFIGFLIIAVILVIETHLT
ncbi:twin-arginine translocation signal domain-containing protein [Archangium gephyra]|uniref:twin-arginine translocation signal domain-containing protein n=1 Tax=Archangium gephyra TaxID=48 RepID=UPI003B805165